MLVVVVEEEGVDGLDLEESEDLEEEFPLGEGGQKRSLLQQ
jgi:hypothetical protein